MHGNEIYIYICIEILESGTYKDSEEELDFEKLSLQKGQLKHDVESAQEGLWGLGKFGLFNIFEIPN